MPCAKKTWATTTRRYKRVWGPNSGWHQCEFESNRGCTGNRQDESVTCRCSSAAHRRRWRYRTEIESFVKDCTMIFISSVGDQRAGFLLPFLIYNFICKNWQKVEKKLPGNLRRKGRRDGTPTLIACVPSVETTAPPSPNYYWLCYLRDYTRWCSDCKMGKRRSRRCNDKARTSVGTNHFWCTSFHRSQTSWNLKCRVHVEQNRLKIGADNMRKRGMRNQEQWA